jgi:hypothetical protein
MDALADAAQRNRRYVIDGEVMDVSTQWSAVLDPTNLTALVCLNGDFGRVYRLDLRPSVDRE